MYTKGELKYDGELYIEVSHPIHEKIRVPIAFLFGGDVFIRKANAAEFVRRWNAFEELLAVCEEIATLHESGDVMASLFGGGGMLGKVQAAIEAAKKPE